MKINKCFSCEYYEIDIEGLKEQILILQKEIEFLRNERNKLSRLLFKGAP